MKAVAQMKSDWIVTGPRWKFLLQLELVTSKVGHGAAQSKKGDRICCAKHAEMPHDALTTRPNVFSRGVIQRDFV